MRILIFLVFSIIITACGGGGSGSGSSTGPGEGQTIMVHRSNTDMFYDLYQVRENGGGVQQVSDTGDGATYHAISSTGRIIYTRTVKDTYFGEVLCYLPLAYCYREERTAIHHIINTANPDGKDRISFEDYPDNDYIENGVVVKTHNFIALTSNDRVIYDKSGKLWSSTIDGSQTVMLLDSASMLTMVSDTGRIIYSASGNIYSIQDDGTTPATLVDSTANEDLLYINKSGEIFYTRDNNGQIDIYRIQDDGSNPQILVNAICVSGENCNIWVIKDITPGGRLVFTKQYNDVIQGWIKEIYGVKIDGSETPHMYCRGPSCDMRIFTPNGRVLIYNNNPSWPISVGNLYSFNEDGTDILSPIAINTILDTKDISGFTPSGRIIFKRLEETKGPGGKSYYDLYTIDDFGEPQPLVITIGEDDRLADITKSGKLLIQRTDNIVKQLYIANEDGSGMTLLTTVEFGGKDGVDVAKASTINGRVIYSSTIYTSETSSHTDLRSVREDGSGDVILAGSQQSELFAGMF